MPPRTRSSPSQSSDDISPSDPRAQCDLTLVDEKKLIEFLVDHRSQAGDAAAFEPAVWNAAARHIKQYTTKGAPKAAGSCSSKWTRVRLIYCLHNSIS